MLIKYWFKLNVSDPNNFFGESSTSSTSAANAQNEKTSNAELQNKEIALEKGGFAKF